MRPLKPWRVRVPDGSELVHWRGADAMREALVTACPDRATELESPDGDVFVILLRDTSVAAFVLRTL
jgi:hypothetical protein